MAKRARGVEPGSPSRPLIAPVALLALLVAPACRADWKFTPAVELRETYSDNVALAVSEQAKSQFVTELAPSFSIVNNGPRLKLSAAYQLHSYAYSGDRSQGTNQSSRDFRGTANAKLIENFLYFDATGSLGQQSISAFGPQAVDNGYTSTNRTEVKTYRISPYIQHRFGPDASMELRYARDSVEAGNTAFGHSQADNLSLSIASGPAFRTLGWGLSYNRQQLDDSLTNKSTTDTAVANLRYQLSPIFALTATAGYDKFDYQSLGGETRGKNWTGGFAWNPSLRTSVQASAGKRYYGSTYLLTALHRSRSTVWTLNYNDAVTTARSQFLLPATIDTAALLDRMFTASLPDPIARQQAVAAYISATGLPPSLADSINYLSNRYFVQKQLQASVAFGTSKTKSVLSVFDSRRTALSTRQSDSALLGNNLSTLNDDNKQLGGNLTLSYQLSSRSSVSLAGTYTKSESLSTGIKDDSKALQLFLTRQFKQKLRGAVELRHVQGSTGAQSSRTYRENAVSATLSMQL